MLLRYDHVQLAIPEGGEDRARGFFGATLGMTEVAKPPGLDPTGCWFEANGVELHLGVEPGFVPARKAHPAFVVADLDVLAERLAAAGHAVRWDHRIPERRRLHCDDPFGNRLEFLE